MTIAGSHLGFPAAANVSRETVDKLSVYHDLLLKWSPRINLVAKNTLPDAWNRHIVDSAQLVIAIPEQCSTWADLGSGAGFPGLVIAILRPDIKVTLIESDARKAAFLRSALRETGTEATVLTQRIEDAKPQNADIISARALAPLPDLLEFALRHLKPTGTALFQKGRQFQTEIDAALETWRFRCETLPSRTSKGAALLRLTEIARV